MNGSIFIEGRRMMEKPVIRISVRNLVEFILRNGDLESGGRR